MKFSPCTSQCTSDGDFCRGCGRSHNEIRDTSALWAKVAAHMLEYGYDDPEKFLETLNQKSLRRLTVLQENRRR
ncbi:DUF1289 domain-containing protein [Psychromonas ossibalaenae]|uniref:DUF1289 domain-containing protein n=1 Tax=Psychromonas ossibalaenae TaxID=444922 RepID=UPI000365F2CB|nr:DUF1289 domain-containing protein [Psychromonas ossibalaenae]